MTAFYKRFQIALSKGAQSAEYTEVGALDSAFGPPHKIRFLIKRDSYIAQSHARIEAWTPVGWKLVHEIHTSNMITITLQQPYAEPQMLHFQEDRDELLRVAEEVLR